MVDSFSRYSTGSNLNTQTVNDSELSSQVTNLHQAVYASLDTGVELGQQPVLIVDIFFDPESCD